MWNYHNHLAEVVRSKPSRRIYGENATYPPILAGGEGWRGGGGSPKGLVHNLLMQFFNPDSSKIEVFETCFFDIVTTQNDISSYAKHVLGRIYVFFTLFGC